METMERIRIATRKMSNSADARRKPQSHPHRVIVFPSSTVLNTNCVSKSFLRFKSLMLEPDKSFSRSGHFDNSSSGYLQNFI